MHRRRPENVLIMRNIAFEGLKSGHKVADMKYVLVRSDYLDRHPTCLDFKKMMQEGQLDFTTYISLLQAGMLDGMNPRCPEDGGPGIPLRAYRGAQRVRAPFRAGGAGGPLGTFSQEDGRYGAYNCGHMGNLDDPATCNRLYGAFVYSSRPDPRNH